MKTTMNYNDAKRYVRTVSTVRYVEEKPFIIAIVELQDVGSKNAIGSYRSGRLMVAKGLSTCSVTDRWDTKMGQDVARGRAEAKLARRVMRQVAIGGTAQKVTLAVETIVAQAACITNVATDGIVYKV